MPDILPLDYTGERYIPDRGWAAIAYEHLSRYLWACGLARGKHVLDLGSGEGYGARLLADVAASVVGVEVAPDAVAHANGKYAGDRNNLSFVCGSALALPLCDHSIEVVVCFEVLANLAEHELLLSEVRRVLTPSGCLVISTPNKAAYSDQRNYYDKYHVKELQQSEFRALLSMHFPSVRLFGQKNITGNLIVDLADDQAQAVAIKRLHRKNHQNEFEPVAPEIADHMYYLAVCRAGDEVAVPAGTAQAPVTASGLQVASQPELALQGQLIADRDERLAMEPGEKGHRLLVERDAVLAEVSEQVRNQEHELGQLRRARQQAEQAERDRLALEPLQDQAREFARELLGERTRAQRGETQTIEPEQSDYDLIIPNFNSRQVVGVCLDSLLRTTDHRHRIIIVDDASTDPEVEPLLRAYAARWDHIKYIRLPVNMGFPGAVNTGIAASTSDVVIINSDTEFPEHWLARLDRCRRSDPRIHIISPLSNNATVCSVPQVNKKNLLPRGMTVDRMAQLVAESSWRRYPRVPTAVGYCMLVTREVIDQVGVIDMAFGRGYGEEVDWCQRAWAHGFHSVLCDDGFVYHHGEVGHSEFADKRKLQEDNEREVGRRWPHYHHSVKIFCLTNPLRPQHQQLFEALRRKRDKGQPKVMQVVHSYGVKAGTELHTKKIVETLAGRVTSTVLYPCMMEPWFNAISEEDNSGVLSVRMNLRIIGVDHAFKGANASLRSRLGERFFAETVAGSGVDVVHFQHLQNYGSLHLPIIARALGKKVVLTLHDYFLLCPDWNMMDASHKYCGEARASACDKCVECLRDRYKKDDRAPELDIARHLDERYQNVLAALLACDVVIAPSVFVKQQFTRALGPAVGDSIRVLTHGTAPYPQRSSYKPAKELRVAFLGNMTVAKGGDVFLAAVDKLTNSSIKFRVFGALPLEAEKLKRPNLSYRGPYEQKSLPVLLGDIDVVVIPPVWNETYCYTVDEALRAGVPVVASRVGAIPERIIDGHNGLLVNAVDPDGLACALQRLDISRPLLAELRQHAAATPLKTHEENMNEYNELYHELARLRVDRSEVIIDRMQQNCSIVTTPPITLEEYCRERQIDNPMLPKATPSDGSSSATAPAEASSLSSTSPTVPTQPSSSSSSSSSPSGVPLASAPNPAGAHSSRPLVSTATRAPVDKKNKHRHAAGGRRGR